MNIAGMKILVLIIAISIPELLLAQKKFVLKPGLDISLSAIGGGVIGFDKLFLEKKHVILSERKFNSLQSNQLFFSDKPRKEFSIPAKISDGLLIGTAAPVIYYLIKKENRINYGTYMVMYLETLLLNSSVTDIVKYSTNRPRPYVYTFSSYDEFLHSKKPDENNLSFYSGHTSTIAASSFFMARTITLNEPDKTKKTLIWVGAATIPAVQGCLRVAAGKHFATDVLTGYIMGAVTGYLIPTLHITRK